MDKVTFNLPAFYDENTNLSDIHLVQQHIAKINLQRCAQRMLNFFNKHPNITSFSFNISHESNDEGGTYLYPYLTSCVNSQGEQLNEGDEIYEKIQDRLYNLIDDEQDSFFFELCENELNKENIHQNVRVAMGEKEFDLWQSTKERAKLEKSVAKGTQNEEVLKI